MPVHTRRFHPTSHYQSGTDCRHAHSGPISHSKHEHTKVGTPPSAVTKQSTNTNAMQRNSRLPRPDTSNYSLAPYKHSRHVRRSPSYTLIYSTLHPHHTTDPTCPVPPGPHTAREASECNLDDPTIPPLQTYRIHTYYLPVLHSRHSILRNGDSPGSKKHNERERRKKHGLGRRR